VRTISVCKSQNVALLHHFFSKERRIIREGARNNNCGGASVYVCMCHKLPLPLSSLSNYFIYIYVHLDPRSISNET
jgi:hypothetical protein